MTRQEFIDSIDNYSELKEFCYDNDCNILEDVYDEEARDEMVNEWLVDWARNDSWKELRDRLDNINDDYYWYRYDDCYDEWVGLNDYEDFDNYKNEVLEWADEYGCWDDPEDEEEETIPDEVLLDEFNPELDADEPEPVPEEVWHIESCDDGEDEEEFDFSEDSDMSVGDMITAGIGCLREIRINNMQGNSSDDDDVVWQAVRTDDALPF